eukprot:Gb_36270 [translate_table: standard]
MKCSICLYTWHDVVSVTPCLHNFCNACFSQWYKRSIDKGANCICPQCRSDIYSVGRNHTLHNIVEDMLKDNPSLQRSAEDTMWMDKIAMVTSDVEAPSYNGGECLLVVVGIPNCQTSNSQEYNLLSLLISLSPSDPHIPYIFKHRMEEAYPYLQSLNLLKYLVLNLMLEQPSSTLWFGNVGASIITRARIVEIGAETTDEVEVTLVGIDDVEEANI